MRRVTLTQYLIEQQRSKGIVSAELRLLIEVVARACKAIGNAVSKGALAGVLGGAGTDNIQGEAQKKLDVIANDVLVEANEWGGHLAAMASEEMDEPLPIPNRYPKGEFLLCTTRWMVLPISMSTYRSAPFSRCCAAPMASVAPMRAPFCNPAASRWQRDSRSTARQPCWS